MNKAARRGHYLNLRVNIISLRMVLSCASDTSTLFYGMTEKEKVEKATWYIGNISSYDVKESSWKSIFLKEKGDCVASRYALAYMCQHMGIKAQACGNLDCHGETLVQADGDFYIVVMGYNEPKLRHYMIYELYKDNIDKIINYNDIWTEKFIS